MAKKSKSSKIVSKKSKVVPKRPAAKVSVKAPAAKSKAQLNEEARIQNAQAEQDVAAEDTELGEAIKHANKDMLR